MNAKCVICGRELPPNMTQLLIDLKGHSACLSHEGSKELVEWVIKYQRQRIEILEAHNSGMKEELRTIQEYFENPGRYGGSWPEFHAAIIKNMLKKMEVVLQNIGS